MSYESVPLYMGSYAIVDRDDERVARVATFLPGPMVSVDGARVTPPALARVIGQTMVKLADELDGIEPVDMVERDSIIEALRDAERNDSASDAVEFIGDLIGWSAVDDPVLQAERAGGEA